MMLLVVERTSCFNVPTSTLYHRSILRFGWDLLYNDRERLNGISILQSSQNQNSHSRNNRCILSLSHTPQSTNKPTLTGRNKSTNLPKSNRVAIRWVVESIEKVLIQERIERGNKIVQGDTLSKVKATPDEEDELVSIMNQFHTGKSKREIIHAGDLLSNLNVEDKFSFAVQERIMKTVAMAGLIQLSCQILDSMIAKKYVPSSMGYIAVLIGLRKVRKVNMLEETMSKLAAVCKETDQWLETPALNVYLGALCDAIMLSPSKSSSRDIFNEAFDLLQPNIAQDRYTIKDGADTCSYNTVLNVATSPFSKNLTLATEIIDLMAMNNIAEDIYTYNLRLRACGNGQRSIEDKMEIFEQILSHPIVSPDKFTVEQMLLPLAKNGRVGDILELLRDFNLQQQSETSISNAYSTFLIALVKGGEIHIAREIFSTYILPLPNDKNVNNNLDVSVLDKTVKPIRRHFNVLIEGYKNMSENQRDTRSKHINKYDRISPQDHAAILFDTMIAMEIEPDAYTFTSLIGLQQNTEAVTKLSKQAELFLEMTTPTYHSIITAYGRVNDPSSACYIFHRMIGTKHLKPNSWNVLLSALSKVSKRNLSTKISCFDSYVSSQDENAFQKSEEFLAEKDLFIQTVDGKNSIQAALGIFNLMKDALIHSSIISPPNSQSFCLIASILSHEGKSQGEAAIDLFKTAIEVGVPADGRFMNSVIRCFGNDIDGAIQAWKTMFRSAVLTYENRDRPSHFNHKRGKNLIAAYHGLVHVSGRAARPDLALRLAYAMKKEGIEPTELTLNSYKTGATKCNIEKSIRLNKQYENLLTVECLKYDKLDKRRSLEKRVRIII